MVPAAMASTIAAAPAAAAPVTLAAPYPTPAHVRGLAVYPRSRLRLPDQQTHAEQSRRSSNTKPSTNASGLV